MKALKILAIVSLLAMTQAFSAITGSKHDLQFSAGNTVSAVNGGIQEICVFCHTPHAANTAFDGAPLWNKASNAETYTMYGATIAGTSTAAAPANSSKACLSCHDGASAINSIVNAPGSGLGGDAAAMSGGLAKMVGGSDGVDFLMPAGATNLGTDLSNDHPVSITYTAGKASLKATGTDLGTGWTTASGDNDIASLLRGGFVECASCHDPHLGENTTFLRSGTNVGSKLCIGCHDK